MADYDTDEFMKKKIGNHYACYYINRNRERDNTT
jgi:hypothetical protein